MYINIYIYVCVCVCARARACAMLIPIIVYISTVQNKIPKRRYMK